MTTIEAPGQRVLPRLTAVNRSFWTGGAGGRLLVSRCAGCRRWSTPPVDECPSCGGPAAPEAVSGRAKVFTWTVNRHQFHPDIPPPNLIAIVVLDEQDDLRLATNLVGCDEADVHTGMPVTVVFEDHGEIFYPVFIPAADR